MYKVAKADLAPIVTEPQAVLRKYFSTDDYPLEAFNKNQSGIVGVLLWVEPDGRVSTCEVIEPIAALILEQATCTILKRRARFTPAKNAAGKAVRAPTSARIKWQL
jgi:protein TonB